MKRRRRLSEIFDVVEHFFVAPARFMLDVGQRSDFTLHFQVDFVFDYLFEGGGEGTRKKDRKSETVKQQ